MNRRVLGVGLLVLLASGSCGTVPPLANTRESAEALAGAVLDALASRDRAALEALALSEQEFRDHVWPELPAARPERNLPFSYVWGDLHQKSDVGLRTIVSEHGGKRYELVNVRATGETTRYDTYLVHRDMVLVIRDPGGAAREIRLFGSMIEKDGGWKVYSFVVD
ncbi:MAG: hypothetical protein ABL993_12050 [Vicinamibacterales bacterium]